MVTTKISNMPHKQDKQRYIIPHHRNNFIPGVKRSWLNKDDPKIRTLVVTIKGVDHIYPPKAGVIIFNSAMDKILTVKNRGYGHESKWGIPKGHLDPEELPYQCAMRELWEETGIKLTIDQKAKNFIKKINNTVYYIYKLDEKLVTLSPNR